MKLEKEGDKMIVPDAEITLAILVENA